MVWIMMLEDDHDRIKRFQEALSNRQPPVDLRFERTACDFIEAYAACLRTGGKPDLIALDHDLFTDDPDAPDPGDGRDVARFLADSDAVCPILIHSTNSSAADSMLYALLESGWIADRIAPIGHDWIEEYWCPYLGNYLHDGGV